MISKYKFTFVCGRVQTSLIVLLRLKHITSWAMHRRYT